MLSPLEELMLTLNLHAHGRHAWTTYGLRGVYLRIANIPTARRQPRNNDKNVPTGHLMPLLVARESPGLSFSSTLSLPSFQSFFVSPPIPSNKMMFTRLAVAAASVASLFAGAQAQNSSSSGLTIYSPGGSDLWWGM